MWTWRQATKTRSALPVERLGAACRTGLRHARYNPALRATLVRAFAFFFFGSAFWALLPLFTRLQLLGGPALYGALLGAIGGSAVIGALVMPWIVGRIGNNGCVVVASLGTAMAMILFALANSWLLAVPAGVLAGSSWIAAVASLNVSAQAALPDWGRGLGMAIYMIVS